MGILKDLGFINADGTPQQRYFEFMDRSQSKGILANAIREAYAELFAINTKANELNVKEVKNKLRTLYAGKKTDLVIGNIAKTFVSLCQYADFSVQPSKISEAPSAGQASAILSEAAGESVAERHKVKKPVALSVESLQYHINIVLPESRDQAVYDAIFKSLREHLS